MAHPELTILGLNVIVIIVAYFLIYPKFCGRDGKKIVNNDLIATAMVLSISGTLFWGSGQQFNMIFFSVNWFWFTLITYAVIETPLMIWYFNRYDVWPSLKP